MPKWLVRGKLVYVKVALKTFISIQQAKNILGLSPGFAP
jgi:hypothetical protein